MLVANDTSLAESGVHLLLSFILCWLWDLKHLFPPQLLPSLWFVFFIFSFLLADTHSSSSTVVSRHRRFLQSLRALLNQTVSTLFYCKPRSPVNLEHPRVISTDMRQSVVSSFNCIEISFTVTSNKIIGETWLLSRCKDNKFFLFIINSIIEIMNIYILVLSFLNLYMWFILYINRNIVCIYIYKIFLDL